MAHMQYRVLGTSGMKVSQLCLGTMMFGGPTDASQAGRIIDHALESGVNFIDTANVYTEGRSEAAIGPAIKAKRHSWVLATKVAQKAWKSGTEPGSVASTSSLAPLGSSDSTFLVFRIGSGQARPLVSSVLSGIARISGKPTLQPISMKGKGWQ